jgi:hypothetical protein
VITPFEPVYYNEARQGFNRAIQQYPLVIVYCNNKDDVSNAVIWARKHSVPIRIRSGGHNYEGYSNGTCTLIIDISLMNHMDLDECRNQLYVEGGVTNRLVYGFVASKGYPFPGGTCPTVGVSGYSLGGGWGLSCRYFGLGCDSLLEIDIIDYEGNLITANRMVNSDLFWACCGAGGGNFGIIVSMIFKLPPKVKNVTLIEIDYLHVSPKDQEAFMAIWQEWLATEDSRMTLISRIYNSDTDGLAMLVRGIFYGEPEEAKKIMKNFLKLPRADYNIEKTSFLEAVTIIGSAYPSSEKFESVSRFVIKYLERDEISDIVDLIRDRPKGSVFAGISMYALGGKVSQVGKNDTAFFYRDAKYIIWLETIWEDKRYAEGNKEWIRMQFPYFKAVTTGSYVNFPYGELPDYLDEYYGTHVNTLIKIKEKYDPQNIFTFLQGIKPSNSHSDDAILSEYNNDVMETTYERMDDANYRGFRYVSKKMK